MIPLLLMLAAADAPPQTPIEAERAFAADAQTIGQWTAFRKWATDDATMFVPQPVNAQAWLKDKKDPAKAIDWWPTASYISCDGQTAVNTGGWQRPDGAVGYFTTVWQHQNDGGWKWVADGGDTLATSRPRPTKPEIVRAKCSPTFVDGFRTLDPTDKSGGGTSDGTLFWDYVVKADGSRRFTVSIMASDRSFETRVVIDDTIPAPSK